jgi:lipopolysaccharide biosynthesis regulator YciM
LPEAEKLVERAITDEPTLLRAHFYLVGLTMQQQKYAATLAALKKQDQTFQIVYKDFKTVTEYAGFVNSPQYQEWLKYLAQKAGSKKAEPRREPAATKHAPANKAGSPT